MISQLLASLAFSCFLVNGLPYEHRYSYNYSNQYASSWRRSYETHYKTSGSNSGVETQINVTNNFSQASQSKNDYNFHVFNSSSDSKEKHHQKRQFFDDDDDDDQSDRSRQGLFDEPKWVWSNGRNPLRDSSDDQVGRKSVDKTIPSSGSRPQTSLKLQASKACYRYVGSRGAVGGKKADLGEFPHMAIIGWPARVGGITWKCGGSLISSWFILTAGHCLQASSLDTTITNLKPSVVRLGDLNIFSSDDGAEPEDYGIYQTIKHPDYDPPRKYNDIGLIQLDSKVKFSKFIRPACIPSDNDDIVSKQATATGWGATESGSQELSPDLIKVTLDLLNSRECDNLLEDIRNRNWWGFRDTQICAGILAGNVDTCQGDSGGPLALSSGDGRGSAYKVIGITSFGHQCGRRNRPGVYTKVSEFTEWISSYVWPDDIENSDWV